MLMTFTLVNFSRFFVWLGFSFLLISCGTSNSRLTSEAPEVLWNDTDAQLVAEKMINELVTDSRHDNSICNCAVKEEVSIAVGEVRDLSRERLDMHKFSGNLERKLLLANSPNLYGLAKDDQQSRNEWLKKTDSDFILHGSVNRIADELSGANARFYQVDLVLIERATNTKTWQGQTKIRKSANQNRSKTVARSTLPL